MTDRTHWPFIPGDVCIGQNLQIHLESNGMECIVLEIVKDAPRVAFDDPGRSLPPLDLGYLVRWADMTETIQAPHQLRLRRPPQSDSSQWIREATTTWDKCDWRPSGVVA